MDIIGRRRSPAHQMVRRTFRAIGDFFHVISDVSGISPGYENRPAENSRQQKQIHKKNNEISHAAYTIRESNTVNLIRIYRIVVPTIYNAENCGTYGKRTANNRSLAAMFHLPAKGRRDNRARAGGMPRRAASRAETPIPRIAISIRREKSSPPPKNTCPFSRRHLIRPRPSASGA